jgi:hypothetical protein
MASTNKSTDKETCAALKTVSNSNQRLTAQAEKKAHILIQVSALMISVLLIFILRINDDHRIALLPVMALMITCLVVIILALMATRPRMLTTISPVETAEADGFNLLFFGSYDALGLDEFHSDMKTLMADENLMYVSLTRDIYFQAVILGKKYRFLRMSYHVFMTGLAISVLSFIIIAFR